MIRFLQQDNRVVKALFVVIIAAASVSMVVYLIPGLTGQGGASTGTYAVVYPHWYSKFFSSGDAISQQKVSAQARQQLQQRNPQYASNPMIVNLFEQQVGQQLVQQQILLAEADKLGISANSDDVAQFLHAGTGRAGAVSERQVHRAGPICLADHNPVRYVGGRFRRERAARHHDSATAGLRDGRRRR